MRRTLLLATVCAFAFLIVLAPAHAQDGLAEWTYMQYFAMDNNLEANIYNDLTELQAAGSTDKVNLVAQVDRIDGYETRFGDWTDTRRFLLQHEPLPELSQGQKIEELLIFAYGQPGVEPDDLRAELRALQASNPDTYQQLMANAGINPDNPALIDRLVENYGLGRVFTTEPIETLGEVNMGAPESLADFLIWSIQNFPAQHYALTISSHGSGWVGNGPDDTDNKDLLQLPEIAAALQYASEVTGVEKLDLIGFDACLMGQLEVYQALAPYTNYVLAAEEVIPGNGWEYTTPFTQLVNDPTMNAEQLGSAIVDAYMGYYAGPGARTKVDLHLVDTSLLPGVLDAMSEFAAVSGPGMAGYLSALGVARINAQPFGGDAGDALGGGGQAAFISSVDLVSLMELVAGQADLDPALIDAAAAVSSAAQAAVVYGGADSLLPDAHGMAIYFPVNARDSGLLPANFADLIPYAVAMPDMAAWARFLVSFYETTDTALTPGQLSISISSVLPEGAAASIYDPPVALFDTDGQGIANLAFLAVLNRDDGTNQVVDYSPLVFESILPDGRVVRTFPSGESLDNTFAWNVETLVLSDGSTELPALLFINNAGTTQGVISGVYVAQDGTETSASVVMDTSTQRALSTYGITDQGAPFEINVRPGDKFFPNWYTLTGEGLSANVGADFLVFGLEPFSYRFVPASSGNYTLTMLVQDLAGNTAVSSAAMLVDNTGLDPAWRGFKDLALGFNFLYPWDWSDPSQLTAEDGTPEQLVATDPEGAIDLYIAMYGEVADTVVQQTVETLSELADAQVEEPVPLDGKPGYVIGYTYTADDGMRHAGTVIVLWSEDNGATYTFDIDAPEGRADDAIAVLNTVYGSLTFFPPMQ